MSNETETQVEKKKPDWPPYSRKGQLSTGLKSTHQNVKGFKRGQTAFIEGVKNGQVLVKGLGGISVKQVPLDKAKHFQVYETYNPGSHQRR